MNYIMPFHPLLVSSLLEGLLEEVRIRRPTVDGAAHSAQRRQTCEMNLGGMACVTMEPVEEQGSFWDHQTPGWN